MLSKSKSNVDLDTDVKDSITFNTLLSMTIRVTIVVLAMSLLSYFKIVTTLESQVKDKLAGYIKERGEKESTIFTLAKDNHTILLNEYLQLLSGNTPVTPEQFDQTFEVTGDGSSRMYAKKYDEMIAADGTKSFGHSGFIAATADLNDLQFKNRVYQAHVLLSKHQSILTTRFENAFFAFPENAAIAFWPNIAWGLEVESDHIIPDQEWYYTADQQHNPERKTVWTSVYVDTVAQLWMITCITPVYVNDQLVSVIGHDYVLDKFFDRLENDELDGSFNLMFKKDGQIITPPESTSKKIAKEALNQNQLDDIFTQVHQQMTTSGEDVAVLSNDSTDALLAVSKITGPDIYVVTVFPKELMNSKARSAAKFILTLSIVSLIIELLMLYSVLKTNVIKPLKSFVLASNEVKQGHYEAVATSQIKLPEERSDEVGLLARTFKEMAVQVNNHVKQLADAQQQMILQEKMASLGTLTAGIAHEINNPSNFVHVGAANLLVDLQKFEHFIFELITNEADEDIVDYFKDQFKSLYSELVIIKDGSGRIKLIVQDLRLFSHMESDELKDSDIVEGLNATLNLVKTKYTNVAKFITDFDDIAQIECYAAKMNQVFMNIIVNACDAIQTRESQIDDNNFVGQLEITCRQIDNVIIIEFKDNGCGMNEQTKNKLFEPFFTTKTVGKGTGLGMAMVFSIIEDHHGSIEVDSMENVGTAIILRLPVS